MNKLTDEQIKNINKSITERENHEFGVKDVKLLAAIADEPYKLDKQGDFYLYKGLIDKVAKLGYLLSVQKPFKSCNIKTAFIAVITLLKLNGTELRASQNELQSFIECLKNGLESEIQQWLINTVVSDK